MTLSIPTPCSQQWNSFTPVAGGGFCKSCSKVVVDFTAMSDEEIVNYFQHTSGATCGRFLPQQLTSYTLAKPAHVQPGLMLLRAGVLSLLFLAVPKFSSAQTTFKGVVTSAEDHSALPGINVVIKGTATGTVTDADGRFELSQPLKEDDVLVFSFIGLVTKEYKVNVKNDLGIEVPVQLCMDDRTLTGEVRVDGVYTEHKRGFWSKVKSFFGA